MIIVRYLIRETIKSQFAIFFILFMVFVSQKFISVLADASDGDIPASLIFSIVGLNMPSMGLLMLPLSLYVGILITFGRLYAESEITVMNATGIGNKFLIQAALYLALITSAIAAYNTLFLSPWSQDRVAGLMEEVAADNSVELLQKGQFQRTPDGSAVVFIDDVENKTLNSVFVAQLVPRDSFRPSVALAKSGVVREQKDGRQILSLQDGARYEGVPSRLDYMVTHFKQYDALIGQRKIHKKNREWEAFSTIALLDNPDPYAQAELHWRIALVVCIPLLTLLVIPLSSVNPRQGRFAKMGPAIVFYMVYFLVLSATRAGIEDGSIPTSIGMWPVHIALLMAGVLMNFMDSVTVRRIRDNFKQRKIKKAA